MQFGLSKDTVQKICGVFARFPAVEKAVLYGSRAKGNYKTGSDIDLTLYGAELTSDLLADIAEELDELLLPYKIDLSLFYDLENAKLREHIERVGVVFYERKNQADAKNKWEVKKLGDVCKIELGKTPARANKAFWDKERKTSNVWLSIADLLNAEDKVIDDSKEYLSDKGAAISKIVSIGTLLVSFKLTLGRLAFAGRDLFTNEAIAALTIFNERKLSKEFLFYFLHFFDWRKAAENDVKLKGMTLNKAKLKEMLVPIPPLAEQQRIVAVLDEAFAAIVKAKENAEYNLQNARELFKSHLDFIFFQRGKEWKKVKIEHACISIIDCVNKTAPKTTQITPFKMIRTTNVRNGLVNLDSVNYVTEDTYRIWTRRQVPLRGDVILTREAPMGEVGMLLSDDKIFLGQRLVLYRTNPTKLNNEFLLYAFQSEDLQGQIHALASGSTVQHMRVPDSKNLMLPLPELKEQEDIVSTLGSLREETQRLESIYRQKLADLEELKKSILQKAFAGELHTERLAA